MDTPNQKPEIDPSRREFRPNEKRNLDGTMSFKLNGDAYRRGTDGVIRRVTPKIKGKKARKRAATR